jgi:CubicO group peptidase (beta-lactamase class C family)
MLDIHGFCDSRFAEVRQVFEQNFTERGDVGASFALTLQGEFLIDMWAGHRNEAADEPWEENTIVNVYSSTKTMMAMTALVLADRGLLDLYAPVATYWPEFAQNGKENIATRHFLSHSAGLERLNGDFEQSDWYDHDKICAQLASQAPSWEPGTQSGYHAMTQGHLVGEVVRRITAKTLGNFFREEIAEPLGADFHIGTDPEHFPRIGELIPPVSDEPSGEVTALASRTEAWRRAEIPAANGHGNARSLVKVQTALANHGTAFGQTILSEEGCMRVFDEQTNGIDAVLGRRLRFGMGYGLGSPNRHTCYWGGWGGSSVICDLDARLCWGYAMNRMDTGLLGDSRSQELTGAVFRSMKQMA